MASLSSVSSSNSLGNTSLRGFGGMASGIDRDAIIEQMTLGTNTKIESLKSNMTKLQWKQEAYRGITDQILDLTDKFASYSSTSNLKNSSIFSKSLITVHGAESATRFVTATGTSKLVDSIAINAVKRLATATVRQSKRHDAGELKTGAIDLNGGKSAYSKLEGTTLKLGYYDDYNKKFVEADEFKFESSYTFSDGTKLEGKDYLITNEDGAIDKSKADALVNKLNKLAKEKGHDISFEYDMAKDQIKIASLGDGNDKVDSINVNSSALSALGYSGGSAKSISMVDFNTGVERKEFSKSIMGETSMIDGLVGKSLIFEYNGNQKSIQLLTREEAEGLKQLLGETDKDGKPITEEGQFNAFKNLIQERLDKAFGKDAITVGQEAVTGEDGKNAGYRMKFSTRDDSAVAILSNDDALLKTLGLDFGESNRVNVDGKLNQAALGLDANTYTNKNGQLDLKINGVSITGLTANSTISDILSKINSTTAAGVKATYVEATGQFMLVSNETGAGREISLDSELAEALFGGYEKNEDGSLTIKDSSGSEVKAVWNKDKGYYEATVDSDKIRLDEFGNRLNDEGKRIDKDGNLINGAGYRVNEDGKLIDKNGQLIDKNGYLVNSKGQYIAVVDKDGNLLDSKKYLVKEDKDGTITITDMNGNTPTDIVTSDYTIKLINKDGHFIDDKGRLTDYVGNLVDGNGNLIDESGNYKDKNGKLIDEKGNRIDGKGNHIANDKTTLVKQFNGTWYEVDGNGNYLSKETDEDGKETTFRLKFQDGVFYKVDENGEFIKDADGKLVASEKGPTEKYERGLLKGTGADGNEAKGPVHTKYSIKSGEGPVTTTGPVHVHSEAYKVDIISKESIEYGQNALIQVSYGNGVTVDMERSSNTFNLEGLTVTVTGTFGGKYEEKEVDGKKVQEWTADTSQTVTFSAKADVDKALETVKAFFEDFNALVTEINGQITARPDSAYGPLTSAQKAEMDETSIENWENKAKQGILFGDDVMRDLSGSMEGILAKLMSYGINYQDLEKIGISYSEDYLDGGTLVFDESKFRSTMESDPDLVSKLISGGENGGKGLIHVVEDAVTPYATRYASKNGNSYGRLVEVAGTEKKPTTLMSNQIYKQLKEMQENIDKLQSQLKIEQDRYISQFTTMESLLNQMNTQSSYLSQLTA